MKSKTKGKNMTKSVLSTGSYPFLALLLIGSCSGVAYAHQAHDSQSNHDHYDAYLADLVRSNEQSASYLIQRHIHDLLTAPPVKTLVSEIIDATLGKAANAIPNNNPGVYGQWSGLTTWPFVFASAANLPDGRILAWGGNNPTTFNGGTFTYAAIWNPATGTITNANHPSHSLFCGIPVMLEDGRVFVAGGDNANASSVRGTSTFNFTSQSWTRIQDMAVGRWYNGAVALPNGKVFTAVGEPGSQYPEIWTPGTGWSYLNGASLQGAILNHPTITEPKNWLPHFHLAPNGKIFHSGHTPEMNIIDPTGNGSVTPAGLSNTWNTANTPSVMYDEGKILQSGGELYPSEQAGNPSSGRSLLIDLSTGTPSKANNNNMQYPRLFHNEVVLPNGEVMVVGGNDGEKFSDNASQMTPEIWNPVSKNWRPVADISVPRNYHSVALLMADGRVWSGGGGLCGCAADHPNSQVYSPAYLFNADGTPALRPEIVSAPSVVSYGITANVTASAEVARFTMVRMSSTTHTFNSDMRFLNVPFSQTGVGQYALNLHSNRDVMTPGYWMLFALSQNGVPSVAKIVRVSTSNSPVITNPGDQSTLISSNASLTLAASDPNGDALTYNAVGLPQGLGINANSGIISGIPTTSGSSRVVVSVSDGVNTVSTSFVWTIVTEEAPVASPLFGVTSGTPFSDNVQANQQLIGVNVRHGSWIDAIQGVLNTGNLPNHGGAGGILSNIVWPTGEYLVRVYGVYGNFVSRISFVTNTGRVFGPYGAGQSGNDVSTFDFTVPAGREIVGFTGRADQYLGAVGVLHRTHQVPNQPPVITTLANQVSNVGDAVDLTVAASDADGDVLAFRATGLPSGLALNPTSGAIQGMPNTPGTFDVIVEVEDARNAVSALNFQWTVNQPALTINPISTTPMPTNTGVTLTANVSDAINPRYTWSFGDGTADVTTAPNETTVQHSFANPGLYVVRLTVQDDRNLSETTTFIQAIHLPHQANRPVFSGNMGITTGNDGEKLWVVNQDNDSVSVFNAETNAKLSEITVGTAPRGVAVAPDGRVWVTNKGSHSVSIITPSNLAVQTVAMPFASAPFGIAFAPDGSAGYIVLEASGKLLKVNPGTGAILSSVDVGSNPRHVAVQHDSSKALVSRFISRPLPGEATATVGTTENGVNRGGEVVVVNAADMTITNTIVLQHSDKEDTENKGAGVPNYLAGTAISPDGMNAWLPSKQDNVKRGTLRNGLNLNFQNSVRAISSKINLNTLTENYDARIDFDNSGVASAAVFDKSGSYLFVALETSREVVVVDAYGGRELRRIPVGRAPDGLAVSANGKKLFVNNFMDRSVSVIDLTDLLARGEWLAPVTATLNSVGTEKLTATVLIGKQLFYDAKDTRLASDNYMSCASCHNDGGHDGRVWDLTGFGEGIRNTIDLRGRAGTAHGLLHWTANFDEIQDFEGQIRSLAGGTGLMSEVNFANTQATLGTPKAGLSTDLDALAAYVSSLATFSNSPFRNNDGSLTSDGQAGKTLFSSTGCTQCHGTNLYTDSPAKLLHDIGTIKTSSGRRLNTALTGLDAPTLRDAWNTAPYLHDGSASTIADAIRAHNTAVLNDSQVAQLASFVQQIGGSEPAVVNNPPANNPPTIALTSPANGTTVNQGSAINITANAGDVDGTVMRVEFFDGGTLLAVDDSAPYSHAMTNAAVGSHSLTAKAYDNVGAVTTSSPVTVTVTAVPTTEQAGLLGRYYNNLTLSGTPNLQRSEAVNFNWGTASPGAGVNANNFSVRWVGEVTAPSTGSYRFRTISDDGVRLFVNGVRRINNWTDHTATTNTSSRISLVAGTKYNIVMEYYDKSGSATARLQWLTPGASTYAAIPVTRLSNTGN